MNSISIDNIVSKIIRDTRIVDSSYISDFHEWIPEAMGLLKTHAEYKPIAKPVKINYHVGKLSCGLIDITAVEYNGSRLPYYKGARTPANLKQMNETVFVTEAGETEMPSGPVLDLKVVAAMPVNPTDSYRIYLDHIQTTFADGEVTIYGKEYLTDERGLPLIPDHGDYREALYWFARTKMIQTGYEDPVYGKDDRIAFERFEMYAARAISDITYPSVDEKEAQFAGSVYFIPPGDYYDSFFNTNRQEPFYDSSSGPSFFRATSVTLNNGKSKS